jgi:diaminohydroxyphosphoribosylaminopyrimidine deaminase / 5-amino-6-(5-phosphoribosylamino)uracil reductase
MSRATIADDQRYMAAAIRLARRNLGRTGTNPSVSTLLVKDGVIVGRGVTAIGGRPHAETQAIAEAGELAKGAAAYVTLEPCAHHGHTPPCADALVTAGVSRVVVAAKDPDSRVCGKGIAKLQAAGIQVSDGFLVGEAYEGLSGYLSRCTKKRPEVTLKLAVSKDKMIGRRGERQLAITGQISREQVHIMRAQTDAILIGIETALVDDPHLTCRLAGMEDRSPIRIVLDASLSLPLTSNLVKTARSVPLWIAALEDANPAKRVALQAAGCRILSCESDSGRIALPELLFDLGAEGVSSVLVEGGAAVARSFLNQRLADRVSLFTSPVIVGIGGIATSLDPDHLSVEYQLVRQETYGPDLRRDFLKA